MGGIAYMVSGIASGRSVSFWPTGVLILAAVVAGAVLLIVVIALLTMLLRRSRLHELVAMVRARRPDAVVVPGVVGAGAVRYTMNRPGIPGHLAVSITPQAVEVWHPDSKRPLSTTPYEGFRVEAVETVTSNGRSNAVDHLVFGEGDTEVLLVPEYTLRFRADYAADLERALDELKSGLP